MTKSFNAVLAKQIEMWMFGHRADISWLAGKDSKSIIHCKAQLR